MPVIRGDKQRIVILKALEEASELAIDFLMHREHRLGGGAVWPVSQRITQHLMRDFIDSRLVE